MMLVTAIIFTSHLLTFNRAKACTNLFQSITNTDLCGVTAPANTTNPTADDLKKKQQLDEDMKKKLQEEANSNQITRLGKNLNIPYLFNSKIVITGVTDSAGNNVKSGSFVVSSCSDRITTIFTCSPQAHYGGFNTLTFTVQFSSSNAAASNAAAWIFKTCVIDGQNGIKIGRLLGGNFLAGNLNQCGGQDWSRHDTPSNWLTTTEPLVLKDKLSTGFHTFKVEALESGDPTETVQSSNTFSWYSELTPNSNRPLFSTSIHPGYDNTNNPSSSTSSSSNNNMNNNPSLGLQQQPSSSSQNNLPSTSNNPSSSSSSSGNNNNTTLSQQSSSPSTSTNNNNQQQVNPCVLKPETPTCTPR